MLDGELTHHLGCRRGRRRRDDELLQREQPQAGAGSGGALEIAVPRDREGSFEPLLIREGQRRFEGFDERIMAMYARGMTVREIQGYLREQ